MKRLGAILVVASICSGFFSSSTSALYSNAYIEANLPHGITTAYTIDNACRNFLTAHGNMNSFTFGPSGNGTLRNLIAGGYGSTGGGWGAWISARDRPNISSPISLTYGTTSVNLQINGFHTLCATYLHTPGSNLTLAPAISSTTAQHVYDDINGSGNWITAQDVINGDAKDRLPNPIGQRFFDQAKTIEGFKLYGVQVISDEGAGGSISSSTPLPAELQMRVQASNSRFSFPGNPQGSPTPPPTHINIAYNSPTGITGKRTVTARLTYREVGAFFGEIGAPGTDYACIRHKNNDPNQPLVVDDIPSFDYDIHGCIDITMDVAFDIVIDGPWGSTGSTSTSQQFVNIGDTIRWDHTITKTGTGTGPTPPNTSWRLRQTIDGSPTPTDVTSQANSTAQDLNFSQSATGTGVVVLTRSSTYVVQPGDFGKKICRSIEWNPVDVTDTAPGYEPTFGQSTYSCVSVAKSPAASVSGGDVVAGRTDSVLSDPAQPAKVITARYSALGRYYGSWAEYGIRASNRITSSSGGTLGHPDSRLSASTSQTSLTFANRPTATTGYFMPVGARQNLTSLGTGTGWTDQTDTSGQLSVAGLTTQTRYTVPGNTKIQGGSDIPAGKSVVIFANSQNGGTLYINGNIAYASQQYTGLASIPQVIIIADKIVIDPAVERIDAWLITKDGGTISTCDEAQTPYYSGLSSTVCNRHLTLNGTVNAGHIQLRRTFGAEGTDDAAISRTAESINTRSDAYMWAYYQSSKNTTISTRLVQELPPRF